MICVNASNIEKDFEWMKTKKSGFDCSFTNDSNAFSLVALQGPKAFEILKQFVSELPDLDYYSVFESSIGSQPVILARTGYTGEDGFEIFGHHQTIKDLWINLLTAGVTPCGLAARDVLRLEVCYPLYGHELDDEVNPYDAGLGWTVKSQKIKFIGKEALQNKPAKYKLVKLQLDKGIPREGYPVLNVKNEVIGRVTSGTMSVVLNKGICFARIQIDKAPSDEVFLIDIRDKTYTAQLVKKPFVTGGHK